MALDASKSALQSVGSYDLLTKIAEGGMGAVYKAKHRDTGQIVAIKIVRQDLIKNVVLLQRLEKEFRAASTIDHPNIVRALDYCGTGNNPFLVMEFVDGESLGQKLEREGKMPEKDAVKVIAQVCQGLHRAHKLGMIHRDVKPDNILVTRDGTAKLTDLGLVKETEADMNLTRTGRGLGTPHFMAPEQFRNAKNADVRCDIYSLGATLYQMVTGELPFKSSGPLDAWMKKVNNDLPPPRKLVPALSERMDWAIRRALSPDPQLRPTTCREFIEDVTGHSTRKLVTQGEQDAQTQEMWYLVFKDETGASHTVKGTTEGIRRSLKEKLLGDASNVRASRTKSGPFEPLRTFTEFRDVMGGDGGSSGSVARPAGASGVRRSPIPAARKEEPDTSGAPHIDLNEPTERPLSWTTALILFLLALATAMGALFVFFR